jgi:two-component system, chemotaxis family, protein-glutamate methylesterase/glutaminase
MMTDDHARPKVQRPEAVVIGASAGAYDALATLLPALPADYPIPVLVVVHLPPDKRNLMPELLGHLCRVEVREAEEKEAVRGGVVYVAPPDYHLLVETDHRLSLSYDEPVLYSRPSVDVLFEAAADAYGPALIGVILTGANSDGALGLRAICDSGGRALVQSVDQAYAKAMPQAALESCPEARSMTLAEIAVYLIESVNIA